MLQENKMNHSMNTRANLWTGTDSGITLHDLYAYTHTTHTHMRATRKIKKGFSRTLLSAPRSHHCLPTSSISSGRPSPAPRSVGSFGERVGQSWPVGQVRRATLESIGALLLQEATMMDHMEDPSHLGLCDYEWRQKISFTSIKKLWYQSCSLVWWKKGFLRQLSTGYLKKHKQS